MSTVLLELSFPSNWYHEAEADVLYVDDRTSSETSYCTIRQGVHVEQQTYPGHRWRARAKASRQLLGETVVATVPAGAPPHRLVVGGTPPRDASPATAAGWHLGQAAREPLLRAVATLLKILGNALASDDPKYRTLRCSNAAVAAVLALPGVLGLLGAAGFEQAGFEPSEARLVLAANAARAGLLDSSEVLERLQTLLQGGSLPPDPAAAASPPAAAGVSSADGPSASHRCAACQRGIFHDVRYRQTSGESWVSGRDNWEQSGEYRYHCEACNVDLCSACYDAWKGEAGAAASTSSSPARGGDAIHPRSHHLTIIPPITKPWGASGYGVSPAPPPVSSRNRRGPWG